ncbi:hypothetical protein [Bradyrhizobium sp. WD16]|uniref:hypothetical protein n=1 Tax=Bradyrhizobium sp. WD16 TaxID=1521768 RepID=UPI0020A3A287|nr:hypothetical protein [Bradyrhizobium sp. WD16]UTD26401.1 hypothetical protein DB459_05170 [Bradyrhizobium sp. WD16]
MWSGRDAFENDACPVEDDLLGRLYRADRNGLPALVVSVAPELRAMLALYCYRRSHLHELGIAIAGSCDERILTIVGGRAGATLYALSRQAPTSRPATAAQQRRAITLSTAPLSSPPVFDDIDDEPVAASA